MASTAVLSATASTCVRVSGTASTIRPARLARCRGPAIFVTILPTGATHVPVRAMGWTSPLKSRIVEKAAMCEAGR